MPTSVRKSRAQTLQSQYCVTNKMSCTIVHLSRRADYYQPKSVDDFMIISLFKSITDKHLRWGFPKCFHRIRKLGYKYNYKRIYRVYCQLKHNIRSKRNKRLPQRYPQPLSVPSHLGECWSMDLMSDNSENHRRFRTFNVINDFNREALAIDIVVSLSADRVTRYLDRLA